MFGTKLILPQYTTLGAPLTFLQDSNQNSRENTQQQNKVLYFIKEGDYICSDENLMWLIEIEVKSVALYLERRITN